MMKTHTTENGCQYGNMVFAAVDATTFADDTYVNRLVVIGDNGGTPSIQLPAAQADVPFGKLLVAGTETVQVGFLDRNCNTRLVLKGTCVAGDKLVLADPTVAGDEGKVEVGAAGFIIGIAEETGEDGQYVLVRPLGINV